MELFDTHCHLDDEQFDSIRGDVMLRAAAVGVTHILAVGTTAASSRQCVQLALDHPMVSAAVGIQPNYAAEAAADDWDEIVRLSRLAPVTALGETGLDRYWDHTPFEVQQDYFDRHLRLSQQTGLPFVVHMRDCLPDILHMLHEARQRGPLHGVMHSYTGDAAGAVECVSLGLHISFAGMLTYKKSDELRSIASTIPADRVLVETDAPYLSPHPCRGQRPNEPALLVHTARCLAAARGETLDELARQTTANARDLFRRHV